MRKLKVYCDFCGSKCNNTYYYFELPKITEYQEDRKIIKSCEADLCDKCKERIADIIETIQYENRNKLKELKTN